MKQAFDTRRLTGTARVVLCAATFFGASACGDNSGPEPADAIAIEKSVNKAEVRAEIANNIAEARNEQTQTE